MRPPTFYRLFLIPNWGIIYPIELAIVWRDGLYEKCNAQVQMLWLRLRPPGEDTIRYYMLLIYTSFCKIRGRTQCVWLQRWRILQTETTRIAWLSYHSKCRMNLSFWPFTHNIIILSIYPKSLACALRYCWWWLWLRQSLSCVQRFPSQFDAVFPTVVQESYNELYYPCYLVASSSL